LLGILGVDPESLAAKTMEEEVLKKTGVSFDLRGLVALGGQPGESHFPGVERQPTELSFDGIPVNRRFARLHILHGTSKEVPDGTPIGKYVLHFADGGIAELPFVYGQDLRNWWGWLDRRETSNAVLAWTGRKNVSGLVRGRYDWTVRLYKVTQTNPRLEAEVKSLDFVSTGTACAPFLIAVTVE